VGPAGELGGASNGGASNGGASNGGVVGTWASATEDSVLVKEGAAKGVVEVPAGAGTCEVDELDEEFTCVIVDAGPPPPDEPEPFDSAQGHDEDGLEDVEVLEVVE
jgi:hypothetical protein